MRELGYALGAAFAGLVLAAVVVLAPWYPEPAQPSRVVIQVVIPGDFAGQP